MNKKEEQEVKHAEDKREDYVTPDKNQIDDLVLSMLTGCDIIKQSDRGSSQQRHKKPWSQSQHEED